MNDIRHLRLQLGVTQQFLADKAKTSQGTIALYESGKKSPTLATLQRLANSMGVEVIVHYVPPLTREDCRSLAYHQALTGHLKQNFDSIIKHAKKNIAKMEKRQSGAKALFNLWRSWLNLPQEDLILRFLDPGMLARDMRQVSPFSGILDARERFQIVKNFRKDYLR